MNILSNSVNALRRIAPRYVLVLNRYYSNDSKDLIQSHKPAPPEPEPPKSWPTKPLQDLTDNEKAALKLPDTIELATGEAKLLLLLEEMGISDPYFENAIARGPGTKDKPNIVPTFEEKRLVGCICEEDATVICYMWVHVGEPKRCECGYWFKAVPAPDPFEPLKNIKHLY